MRELKLLIEHLRHMLEDVQQSLRSKELENRRLLEMLEDSNRTNRLLQEQLAMTIRENSEQKRSNDELAKMIANLSSQLSAERGARFGRKSQRGTGKKDDSGDSTPSSDSREIGESRGGDDSRKPSAQVEKECMSDRQSVELLPETEFKDMNGNPEMPKPFEPRPYRQGRRHNRPHADIKVKKQSDPALLPEGHRFIGYGEKSVFKKVVQILEEVYQTVIAEDPDGNRYEVYLPADKKEDRIIDCFPGTMASAQMMAESVIAHYELNIPFFRQWQHLKNCGLHLVRQTYINWMYTGYLKLKNLIPHLLEMAVQKDSVINCDETWIKVKVEDRYCKKYTWCLVNREMGIVIYFYKEGSRSRDAFRDILDGRLPMAVQTDGYNVYMYLEDELTDVTHLCCMAHARAKFRTAYEQTGDREALWFLDQIGKLYGSERHYAIMHYTPDKIKEKRNSADTLSILGDMRSRLTYLLGGDSPDQGELMQRALKYMDSFWIQLTEYIKDGRYTIDNNEAERGMKPLANERKNSYFFGSHKMAAASAVYHSLIATCRKCGVSVRAYFIKVFSEIIHGNENWGRLLPMTIGIPVNKT